MKKLYIAYGSNMDIEQMAYRCPGAELIATAEVEDYELLFKGSKTGNYATIEPKAGRKVPALIWKITEKDEKNLDMYEGYPHFYYKENLKVRMNDIKSGQPMGEAKAMVYIMDERRIQGEPSWRYFNVIEKAYNRFGFDKNALERAELRCLGTLENCLDRMYHHPEFDSLDWSNKERIKGWIKTNYPMVKQHLFNMDEVIDYLKLWSLEGRVIDAEQLLALIGNPTCRAVKEIDGDDIKEEVALSITAQMRDVEEEGCVLCYIKKEDLDEVKDYLVK